jgi:formyltetrahydrofolate-dependent phosphoribosylglycinamide formyltransferase
LPTLSNGITKPHETLRKPLFYQQGFFLGSTGHGGMTQPIRLAVLLSGSGTTLQNLLDHIRNGRLAAHVVLVISNRHDAYGLTRAAQAGVETRVISRKEQPSAAAFGQAIFEECRKARVDLVCLAGFMQFLLIPSDFEARAMNIHPSLIPAFCGKGFYGHHVHQAVLAYGAKITGCTVHFVDNEYDHGPIILQKSVPVLADDTPDTLAARVFEQECVAYPEAINLFAEGKLSIEGRKVLLV